MNRYLAYATASLFMIFIVSCKSVSKYTIDEKPSIKTDTSLLGIWKAAEDTDKANFILVQNYDDVFDHFNFSEQYSENIKYNTPDGVTQKNKSSYYYFTWMDRHGHSPHYEEFAVFLSEVKNRKFLNVQYWYQPLSGDNFSKSGPRQEGYFFVRLIHLNAAHDTLTTAIVADTTLKYLSSSQEVRNRIAKNKDNPAFYSDTLHFYKVSGYHASINESKLRAN